MAYTPLNKYLRWKKAIEITREHDGGEWTIYKKLWRKYIHPVLFISYADYMKAINCPNVDELITNEEKKLKENQKQPKKQLSMKFNDV